MSDCNIDVIKTTTKLKAKFFDVQEYKIKLDTGREVTHEVVKRKPSITVFPLTPKNEIYLIYQYRYLLGDWVTEAIAGFIDEGESPLESAKRELREEAGISASSWEEISKLEISASVVRAQTHVFLASDLELGIATPEEDEYIKLVKMPLEEAVKKVLAGEINTVTSALGILMIERMLKRKK